MMDVYDTRGNRKMSFISMEFFFLVVFTMILYYIPLFQKLQVFILVIASLIFYGWDQYRLIPLLMFTVFVTYFSMCGAIRGSKVFVTVGIISNLLILFFFKYKFLIFPSIADLLTDSDTVNFLLHLPLPIGISFFVFHNISLIVDSFKSGQYRDRPSAMQLVLYIIFFPQLVSGPITKASSFMPQIEPKFIYNVPWVQVGKLLITGLFFKLFCANNLAQATALMAPGFSSGLGGGDKLFMLFVYSFQIYADFFGYSTLALGLALLFGYRLPVNFQLPYIATSFSDFWNRWHISLSKWLKHYLYIPLGGNRISASRTYLHLLTVMVLGGLWHGAALSFAVWGFAHGALLAVERFVEQIIQRYFSKYHFNLYVSPMSFR